MSPASQNQVLEEEGYNTDHSQQSQLFCSSRASSIVAPPNMVKPLLDSCIRMNRPPTQKCRAVSSLDSGQSNLPQTKGKPKGTKKPIKAAISTFRKPSGKKNGSGSKPIKKKKKSGAPDTAPSQA